MPERSGHVFMSYSRKDEEVMRRVAKFLRGQGMMVWVDNEKLVPGTPIWEAEIEKAILGAGAAVVLLSPDSKESEWVRREISYAERYRKHIFPVLVRGDENSSISLRLTNYQYVDIRDNEEINLNRLCTAILAYLKEPGIQIKQADKRIENQVAKPSIVKTNTMAAKESRRTESVKPSHLPRWLSVLWIAVAWTIAVSLGLSVLPALYGFTIGAIGGFLTGISLRMEHILARWKSVVGITLSWVAGWIIGWYFVGSGLGRVVGFTGGIYGGAVGGAIGGLGTAFFLYREKILPGWKNILIITLGWSMGWTLVEGLIRMIPIDFGFVAIGALIGAIGGLVTIWQVRSADRNKI